MGTQNNLVAKAVRYALLGGVAAAVATPAMAADDAAKNDDEKIVITGSRIKRTDIEGPSPITVIDREDIEASGDNSVADVLRSSSFNSFGSFRERSGVGNGATGNATISLRGLGSNRTLVLIDGKRAPSSPSFGGGSVQNLNLIPTAAVERIEILRDGASAIYGSDAIGGVVNIVLRKDFDGMVLNAGVERPTQEGADASYFSITTGVSSAKGNITFVVDHFERDQLFNKDRDFTSVGLSVFGFPGSFYAFDPNNNGAFVGTFADSRCPTNLGDSQEFPNSLLRFGGVICGFNYAATSAHSAQIRRDTLFVNANYQITDDIKMKTRATVSRVNSFGRYAPAPAAGGIPGGGAGGLFPSMDANNPNNPTQDPTLFPGGPYDLWIFYRNVPGGPRDSNVTDTLVDLNVGLEGFHEFAGGGDWSINVNHARNKNIDLGTGYGFGSLLQQSIDDGSYDIFNYNGNFDPAVAQSFGHETVFEAQVINFSVDGLMSFDELFSMDGRAVPLVVGFEYNDLDFFQVNDPQSNSGNVFGTSGGDNIFAARFRKSVFAEMVLPILEDLEADIAVRYDQYSDFGSTVNPKVSFAYRPTDDLLLRASYGEGFRAPNMDDLYGNRSQSFDSALDVWGCNNGVPNTCSTTQYQNFTGGNPNLDAETSTGYTAGVVYTPIEDLELVLNYYNIELNDGIALPSLQGILDNDNAIRVAGGAGDPRVVRSQNGGISFVNRLTANLATFKTDGLDLEVKYEYDAGDMGQFSFLWETSYVLSYDSVDQSGAAADVGVGEFFADRTAQPEYRTNLLTTWTRGDFGVNLQVQYIPAMDHIDTTTGLVDDTLDSWTTADLQFTYNTPWNGKVVVGARNITNEDPPINTTTMDSPFYADTVHDIFGRVPYVRYEQSF